MTRTLTVHRENRQMMLQRARTFRLRSRRTLRGYAALWLFCFVLFTYLFAVFSLCRVL